MLLDGSTTASRRDTQHTLRSNLLDGSLRWSEHQTALEQGWLLQEMEQYFGYGLEELARSRASGSLIGQTTASTVSRPNCCSAAIRMALRLASGSVWGRLELVFHGIGSDTQRPSKEGDNLQV